MEPIRAKEEVGLNCEFWYWDEDKPVVLYGPNDIRFSNKKIILEAYLKKISENVIAGELEEEKKGKLKVFYKKALGHAKILAPDTEFLKQKPTLSISPEDLRDLQVDGEGNFYISNDI